VAGKINNFQQISCRITETVQDRTKVLMTNRKSHTPFRLVPKSTLDDIERPIRSLYTAENMRLSEPTTNI